MRSIPLHVAIKLREWIASVEMAGLEEIRKRPGFHDEPRKGARLGQRSIRLSRSYRAIYRVEKGAIKFIEILEVSKHEY